MSPWAFGCLECHPEVGESRPRHRTVACSPDAVDGNRCAAGSSDDLFICTGDSRGRKVPRAGFAAPQDDKSLTSGVIPKRPRFHQRAERHPGATTQEG